MEFETYASEQYPNPEKNYENSAPQNDDSTEQEMENQSYPSGEQPLENQAYSHGDQSMENQPYPSQSIENQPYPSGDQSMEEQTYSTGDQLMENQQYPPADQTIDNQQYYESFGENMQAVYTAPQNSEHMQALEFGPTQDFNLPSEMGMAENRNGIAYAQQHHESQDQNRDAPQIPPESSAQPVQQVGSPKESKGKKHMDSEQGGVVPSQGQGEGTQQQLPLAPEMTAEGRLEPPDDLEPTFQQQLEGPDGSHQPQIEEYQQQEQRYELHQQEQQQQLTEEEQQQLSEQQQQQLSEQQQQQPPPPPEQQQPQHHQDQELHRGQEYSYHQQAMQQHGQMNLEIASQQSGDMGQQAQQERPDQHPQHLDEALRQQQQHEDATAHQQMQMAMTQRQQPQHAGSTEQQQQQQQQQQMELQRQQQQQQLEQQHLEQQPLDDRQMEMRQRELQQRHQQQQLDLQRHQQKQRELELYQRQQQQLELHHRRQQQEEQLKLQQQLEAQHRQLELQLHQQRQDQLELHHHQQEQLKMHHHQEQQQTLEHAQQAQLHQKQMEEQRQLDSQQQREQLELQHQQQQQQKEMEIQLDRHQHQLQRAREVQEHQLRQMEMQSQAHQAALQRQYEQQQQVLLQRQQQQQQQQEEQEAAKAYHQAENMSEEQRQAMQQAKKSQEPPKVPPQKPRSTKRGSKRSPAKPPVYLKDGKSFVVTKTQNMGLSLTPDNENKHIVVDAVHPDAPVAVAVNLQPGDFITSVNGMEAAKLKNVDVIVEAILRGIPEGTQLVIGLQTHDGRLVGEIDPQLVAAEEDRHNQRHQPDVVPEAQDRTEDGMVQGAPQPPESFDQQQPPEGGGAVNVESQSTDLDKIQQQLQRQQEELEKQMEGQQQQQQQQELTEQQLQQQQDIEAQQRQQQLRQQHQQEYGQQRDYRQQQQEEYAQQQQQQAEDQQQFSEEQVQQQYQGEQQAGFHQGEAGQGQYEEQQQMLQQQEYAHNQQMQDYDEHQMGQQEMPGGDEPDQSEFGPHQYGEQQFAQHQEQQQYDQSYGQPQYDEQQEYDQQQGWMQQDQTQDDYQQQQRYNQYPDRRSREMEMKEQEILAQQHREMQLFEKKEAEMKRKQQHDAQVAQQNGNIRKERSLQRQKELDELARKHQAEAQELALEHGYQPLAIPGAGGNQGGTGRGRGRKPNHSASSQDWPLLSQLCATPEEREAAWQAQYEAALREKQVQHHYEVQELLKERRNKEEEEKRQIEEEEARKLRGPGHPCRFSVLKGAYVPFRVFSSNEDEQVEEIVSFLVDHIPQSEHPEELAVLFATVTNEFDKLFPDKRLMYSKDRKKQADADLLQLQISKLEQELKEEELKRPILLEQAEFYKAKKEADEQAKTRAIEEKEKAKTRAHQEKEQRARELQLQREIQQKQKELEQNGLPPTVPRTAKPKLKPKPKPKPKAQGLVAIAPKPAAPDAPTEGPTEAVASQDNQAVLDAEELKVQQLMEEERRKQEIERQQYEQEQKMLQEKRDLALGKARAKAVPTEEERKQLFEKNEALRKLREETLDLQRKRKELEKQQKEAALQLQKASKLKAAEEKKKKLEERKLEAIQKKKMKEQEEKAMKAALRAYEAERKKIAEMERKLALTKEQEKRRLEKQAKQEELQKERAEREAMYREERRQKMEEREKKKVDRAVKRMAELAIQKEERERRKQEEAAQRREEKSRRLAQEAEERKKRTEEDRIKRLELQEKEKMLSQVIIQKRQAGEIPATMHTAEAKSDLSRTLQSAKSLIAQNILKKVEPELSKISSAEPKPSPQKRRKRPRSTESPLATRRESPSLSEPQRPNFHLSQELAEITAWQPESQLVTGKKDKQSGGAVGQNSVAEMASNLWDDIASPKEMLGLTKKLSRKSAGPGPEPPPVEKERTQPMHFPAAGSTLKDVVAEPKGKPKSCPASLHPGPKEQAQSKENLQISQPAVLPNRRQKHQQKAKPTLLPTTYSTKQKDSSQPRKLSAGPKRTTVLPKRHDRAQQKAKSTIFPGSVPTKQIASSHERSKPSVPLSPRGRKLRHLDIVASPKVISDDDDDKNDGVVRKKQAAKTQGLQPLLALQVDDLEKKMASKDEQAQKSTFRRSGKLEKKATAKETQQNDENIAPKIAPSKKVSRKKRSSEGKIPVPEKKMATKSEPWSLYDEDEEPEEKKKSAKESGQAFDPNEKKKAAKDLPSSFQSFFKGKQKPKPLNLETLKVASTLENIAPAKAESKTFDSPVPVKKPSAKVLNTSLEEQTSAQSRPIILEFEKKASAKTTTRKGPEQHFNTKVPGPAAPRGEPKTASASLQSDKKPAAKASKPPQQTQSQKQIGSPTRAIGRKQQQRSDLVSQLPFTQAEDKFKVLFKSDKKPAAKVSRKRSLQTMKGVSQPMPLVAETKDTVVVPPTLEVSTLSGDVSGNKISNKKTKVSNTLYCTLPPTASQEALISTKEVPSDKPSAVSLHDEEMDPGFRESRAKGNGSSDAKFSDTHNESSRNQMDLETPQAERPMQPQNTEKRAFQHEKQQVVFDALGKAEKEFEMSEGEETESDLDSPRIDSREDNPPSTNCQPKNASLEAMSVPRKPQETSHIPIFTDLTVSQSSELKVGKYHHLSSSERDEVKLCLSEILEQCMLTESFTANHGDLPVTDQKSSSWNVSQLPPESSGSVTQGSRNEAEGQEVLSKLPLQSTEDRWI